MRIRPPFLNSLALAAFGRACFLPLLVAGCVAEPEAFIEDEDDGREALAPQPLPLEGSATAFGMLRVANELDHTALDVDVALDRRSADSIIAHRAGADTVLGTADDQYVESIAELDSLYWLGAANLWKIQSHALLEGWVPELVPAAACEPEVDAAIAQCLRFLEYASEPQPSGQGELGSGPYKGDLLSSCVQASDPVYPSAFFFSTAGLPGYLDPTLGYQDLLCAETPAPVCALGVAGLASHVQPECDALYDIAPALSEHEAEPADEADWAAALAALDAACSDGCSHFLRIYEYAPGMAPTLLGDVMSEVLGSAPLEYDGPWLERGTSDVLPAASAGVQTLLGDVVADLGLGGSFDVGHASEEVPCPNCHTFHDSYVLMFRDERIVVVLDVETFWDS